MEPEDIRGVHGEWAVDVNRDLRDLSVAMQPMEAVDQLLNPSDGEGRDQDLAAPRGHPPDQLAEPVSDWLIDSCTRSA